MKTQELQEMMTKDAKIDMSSLDRESVNIPVLHGKWYSLLMNELRQLHSLEFEFDKLRRRKYDYYTGRAEDSDYMNNPLNIKVTRQDIEMYISSDDEIQDLKGRIIVQKMKVDMISEFIKNVINSRSFHIKDAISFIKFKNGQFE